MNLPDNLSAKKKDDPFHGFGVNLNDVILSDMKKKNALNRVNSKFASEPVSSLPASELDKMRMIVPPK